MLFAAASLLVLSAAPQPQDGAASEPRTFQPLDVFELEWAADPQVSPDGSRVVYVRSRFDVMTDSTRTDLWLLALDETPIGHRPLVTGPANVSSPRWSPSGDRLLYVSSEDAGAQIFCRWMESGATAALTHVTESPGSLAWSPDGTKIAFTMFVPKKVKPFAEMPPKPEGATWAEAPRVVERLRWRSDGQGILDDGYRQVFVVGAEGGTPWQVTDGDFDHGGRLAWELGRPALIVSANRREDGDQHPQDADLQRVWIDGSQPIQRLTDRYGPDRDPAISPDGLAVAYTGFDDRMQGYRVTQLYLRGLSDEGTSEAIELGADLDRDVETPTWLPDGRGLVFGTSDHGDGKIVRIGLDGTREVLAEHVGGTSLGRPYASGSFSLGGDGTLAYTSTGADARPADVWVRRPGDSQARAATRLNAGLLERRALAPIEEITVPSSFDGLPIQAWIARPPGEDDGELRPLLLEIHGGPFADYGARFAAEIQLYAAAGYVVVYANPRGSTSYGEEFGNAIHHAYPGRDYDDLMSVVDDVIGRGGIDPDRLYVTGGSGGGVLTAWIVGKTDRFRAAVVAKPVINWASFVLTADAYPFFTRYWFAAMPWDDVTGYWERSPLSLVGDVSTPTMLLVGEQDHRTPISESEQYYQALKLREVPTALVRIPGASHGIASRPSRLIAKVAHVLAWFERYSGDEGEEPDEGR